MVRRYQRRTVPMVGGILLFGRERLTRFPDAYLQVGRFAGTVHADYAQPGAPIRVAVFDDRVAVENPGVLLPGLAIEDLREGVSRVRNRVMARVFHELGLIEQWGTGVQRMVESCLAAGLPEPEFAELGFRFRVTIRTDRSAEPVLDRVDDRIVTYLWTEGGRATGEIAEHVGLSTRSVQHRLASLAERGMVVAVGSGPRDPAPRAFWGLRRRHVRDAPES